MLTILLTTALVIATIAALHQRRRVREWKENYTAMLNAKIIPAYDRDGEFIYTFHNGRHETYRRLLNTEL